MPAHYDMKAIGDQVHRLTLELMIEKRITNILARRMMNAGMLSPQLFDAGLDNTPEASDAEGQLYTDLYHARLLSIQEFLMKPGKPPV